MTTTAPARPVRTEGAPEPAPRPRQPHRPAPLRVLRAAAGLLATLGGAYALVLAALLGLSCAQYGAGDYTAAAARADAYTSLDPLRGYRGPFDAGTARAAAGDLDAAEARLRTALARAPERAACAVRQNLAAVLEQRAEHTDTATAAHRAQRHRLLSEATEILAQAPRSCRPDGSAAARANDAARRRIERTRAEDEHRAREEREAAQRAAQRKSAEKDGAQGGKKSGHSAAASGASGSGTSTDRTSGTGAGAGQPSDGQDDTGTRGGRSGAQRRPAGDAQGSTASADERAERLRERSQRAQRRQGQDQDRDGGDSSAKPW